jgi:alpha/beta hydrolase family protein
MVRLVRVLAVAFLLGQTASAAARLDRVEILRRAEVAGGRSFGAVGPYEKIVARGHFSVLPDDPHNRAIVDLGLAPRNGRGAVEFTADLFLLAPKDQARGNRSLVLEIPNRGGKGILSIVNRASGAMDPDKDSDFGDGFLMNRGFTVAWVGWQWDVRDEANRMRLEAPIATDHGASIRGLVRSDFIVNKATRDQPLGHQIGGGIGGVEYEAAEPDSRDNVLTVRDTPMGARRTIARSQWSFAREGVPDRRSIHLSSGFEPGKIYELVYVAHDPRVAGLGFAAVRDLVAYLKNAPDAVVRVGTALGVGISQSGRFLRHFLFEGFNADEDGRKVFDGLIPHVAGAGRGNFNHRFAQPSRDAQPMNAILYATDLYPFADLPLRDRVTGRNEGLLDRVSRAPKIFYTNTSYEYWSRAASLIHITPDGTADAPLADNVRIYFYAGLQHFSGPFPPQAEPDGDRASAHPQSPLAVQWFWRAMIVAMAQWVKGDTAPPPSRYPRIADHTLVKREALAFPKIPGGVPPQDAHRAWRTDFGPDWRRGIITRQPPVAGQPFPMLVPQVDADGNDLAGIHLPELAAPLATYTGWNLRAPGIGAPGARVSFLGSYFPFPATKDGDPRRPIAERYRDRDSYLGAFTRQALELVRERYLLPEDLRPVLERGIAEWELATRGSR